MNHTHTTNFSSESLSPSSDKAKFPSDFVWGAATSSYQIEGAVTEDGKGAHIWDIFTREEGRIFENHTGEIACDHYHRFKDDVKLMKEMGIQWNVVIASAMLACLPVFLISLFLQSHLQNSIKMSGIK